MNKSFLLISVLVGLSLLFPRVVAAQDISLGTAIVVTVNEKNVKDGSIVSSQTGGGYVYSRTPYESFLFGVVAKAPSLFLYDKGESGGVPVINIGKAYVNVSTENGAIKRGNPITSSTNPGVGMKATQNGYIIGLAGEDYTEKDPKQVGKILVTVDPRFAQINSSLVDSLVNLPKLSLSAAFASPATSLRYLLAAIIAASSFYLGFRFFGHVSTAGVEAIGRNPLAKKAILVGVIVNAALTMLVIIIGFAIAYLILAL